MNKYRLQKQLQKLDAESQAKMLARLKSEMPELAAAAERKKCKTTGKKRLAFMLAPVCAVVLCFCIVLPTMFKKTEDPSPFYGDEGSIPFSVELRDQSVERYNELFGTDILYLDWEDTTCRETYYYLDPATDELVAVKENTQKRSTGTAASVIATFRADATEHFLSDDFIAAKKVDVNGTSVSLVQSVVYYRAEFSYGDYTYFVTVLASYGESGISEVLNDLIK